jgi:hypothetical protein
VVAVLICLLCLAVQSSGFLSLAITLLLLLVVSKRPQYESDRVSVWRSITLAIC